MCECAVKPGKESLIHAFRLNSMMKERKYLTSYNKPRKKSSMSESGCRLGATHTSFLVFQQYLGKYRYQFLDNVIGIHPT